MTKMQARMTLLSVEQAVQQITAQLQPLPAGQAPEPEASPRKVMSYAIQARPALAWREIALMTALFGWAPYELIPALVGMLHP